MCVWNNVERKRERMNGRWNEGENNHFEFDSDFSGKAFLKIKDSPFAVRQ